MKSKDAIDGAADLVMDFLSGEPLGRRRRLYRKIGMDLIRLSIRMDIEQEDHDDGTL